MPRNEQAKSSTLRNRQRITNKTRLKVIHGPIDADPVIIGEDDDRGINKSTAGVDADDAAEHHLQQVLNAANAAQRAATSTFSHPSSATAATTGTGGQALAPPPPPADTFIPTPDAQGVVANYEEIYPLRKLKALSIQRFSDSPEESVRWGLQPKSYTMDERDAAWLEQHNQQARGEGTSTSVGGGPTQTSRRSSKKGKEPEDFSPIVMTEDEFELVMGLFERYTSDHLPYLHLDATLQSIPPFSFFEPFMASPLPPSIFATFVVPPDIPEPDKLFRLAQSIHPHWHIRRVERKGRPIIPDINLDESEEGNVYVCFRRREVKAVRKTRRMEITSVEKLTRLNAEFEIALELVDKVVEREEIKRDLCANDAKIWGHRSCMIAVTNKFPNLRSPEDDKYLIDKEKIKRKPLGVDTTNILRIPRGGLPSTGALFSAGGLRTGLLHEEEQDLGQAIVHPRERYEQIQKLIEGDLHTKNEAMYGMEDHTDMPFQQQYAPGQRSFKNLGSAPPDEGVPPLERMPVPPAFRHRVGRGGRRHLDRRFPPFTKAPLASRPHPAPNTAGATVFSNPANGVIKPTLVPFFLAFPHARFLAVSQDVSKGDGEDEKPVAKRRRVQEAEEMDRTRKIEERWKFDGDGPRLGDVEDRVIVDDFNIQSQMMRTQLIREAEYLVQPDFKALLNHFELGNSEVSKKLLEAHRDELRQLRALHSLPPEQQRSVAISKAQQKQQLLVSMGLLPIQQPILPPGMLPGQVQPSNGLVPGHVQRLPPNMMNVIGPATQQPSTQVQTQPQPNGQGQPQQPSSQTSSQQQLNGTSVPAPSPVPPQVQVQGTPQLPQQSPISANVGAVSTPPLKPPSNGINHLSPSNNAALVTGSLADTGPTVRVSTPMRKMMSATPQPSNGFSNNAPLQPQQLFPVGPGMNGMQMLLQQQKLAHAHAQHMQQQQVQHLMAEQTQQQQQMSSTAQQAQAFQQHQANMAMNGIGSGMNAMSGGPQVAGMIPINSAMNMSVQNMNLALGNPNLQLHLPPNRMQRTAQQQANFAAALSMNGMNGIGPGAGMGMNVNVNGMPMNGIPMNGMPVNGLQQAQHGMSISRAPSVHPGMHPMMHPGMNGMHMRPPSAMSPMMRPPSTAPSNSGVHSVMPSPSLRPSSVPTNPHGSPARPPQVVPPPQS